MSAHIKIVSRSAMAVACAAAVSIAVAAQQPLDLSKVPSPG
jgi:hypothetical protein